MKYFKRGFTRSKDVKKIGGFPLGSPVERWRHDRIEDIKGYVLMKGELYCKCKEEFYQDAWVVKRPKEN